MIGFLAPGKRGLFYVILTLTILILSFLPIPFANAISPISGLHLPFVENQGQAHTDIAFLTPLFNGSFQITKTGEMLLQLPNLPGKMQESLIIQEKIKDALPIRVKRGQPAQTRVSYFLGRNPETWYSNLPTYRSVILEGIQPLIGIELQACGNTVEKRFIVQPEGDPTSVLIEVTGVEKLEILSDGRLALETPVEILHFSRPVAYQWIKGVYRNVDVTYRIKGNTYGFLVGPYDQTKELVIDPLIQASYLGGGNNDYIEAVAVDPNSNEVYVVGNTNSIIPGGPYTVREGYDAFVARLNTDLTELLSLAYLGGTGMDVATSIDFLSTPAGLNVYVAGHTQSDNFSGITAASAQSNFLGSEMGFIAFFDAELATLRGASYFGGSTLCDGAISALTNVSALAVDRDGAIIYMAGTTSTSNLYGRGIAAAQFTCGGGGTDGYVTCFNADLTDFMKTTYVGGSGSDSIQALATRFPSYVYVAGNTISDDLPGVDAGSLQSTRGGAPGNSNDDAFITRIDADLLTFGRSTYFGGSGIETASQLLSHGGWSLYLGGNTNSADLPGVRGGMQEVPNDSFVAEIFPTMETDAPMQSTYLGGSGFENLQDIAYDPDSGYLYVVGSTGSTDLPGTSGSVQETLQGSRDAFVIRMRSSLRSTDIMQATYLGGDSSPEEVATTVTRSDYLSPIAVYVAGNTTSNTFPGISGGAQPYRSSGLSDYMESFISLFDSTLQASIPPAPNIQVDPDSYDYEEIAIGYNSILDVYIANNGEVILNVSEIDLEDIFGTFELDLDTCGTTTFALEPGEHCFVRVNFEPVATISYVAVLHVTSDDPDEATTSLILHGAGITGPEIEVIPENMAFNEVAVGSELTMIAYILNNGNADLTISNIDLIDAGSPSHFSLDTSGGSSPCGPAMPMVLDPTEGCSYSLTFSPQEEGTHTAELIITSDDADESSVTVSMSGEGIVTDDDEDDCCLSEILYGENSEEVKLLRKYRDEVLSKAPEGRKIIRIYYQWSPVIVALLQENELLREYIIRLSDEWGLPIIRAIEKDEAFKEQVKEMIGEILLSIEPLFVQY